MSEAAEDVKVDVSLADVRRVAELANLELSSDEEPRMLHDLTAILGHVAELNELDTSSVEPMAQVSSVLKAGVSIQGVLRPDVVVPSLDRATVLAASPENDGVYFKVPKVIER